MASINLKCGTATKTTVWSMHDACRYKVDEKTASPQGPI